MFTFLLTGINAKYIHSNPAIYSLRAYAGEELRPFIKLAEFTINERVEDILERIYAEKPDVIGFSCYIWNIHVVEALLKEIPKLLPETDIYLGGPEVSFDADIWLKKYPSLTGIMLGEGEETFRELLEFYRNGREKEALSDIAGLFLPSGKTAPRQLLDLTRIPFLYDEWEPFENRIIYYESSRGCPYRCSYCLSSVDKTVRLRDIRVVERELQYFLDRAVPQVKFVDRTFNCSREHTRRIWTYLKEHDNGITNFHFEVSADILNDEEINLLNSLRPGLIQLEIGVQSTNPATISEIHRVMDVEKLAGIVSRIREGRNVHQHLDLIAGLPEEDYESFGRSFDRVYAMIPDQLQMGFLKLLKGSFMHEHAKDYGIEATTASPYEVLYTRWLTYSEVRRLKGIEEMVELYYNSHQYTHVLPYLIQRFSGPFAFFESLADDYRRKGYQIRTPARAYRYQVLLQFGEEGGECDERLRELLVYDLYLRENMKSRPAFAAKITDKQRDFAHRFYEKEAKQRTYLPYLSGMDARALSRQTHLEYFRYPVWEEDFDEHSAMSEKGRYVLFCYEKRDPLHNEAMTILLEE